ncbi:hypothetical protein [Isoptericola aurantiacus]|uniref:hypothetical protein n=1 Tax=Isoptericola aurantiacus TaxID=3377839 RepID=UPI00383AB461
MSRECYDEAQDAGLSYDPQDFETGRHPLAPESAPSPALTTDEGRRVRAEWRECLAEQGVLGALGVSVPRSAEAGMVVVGVFDLPLEDQIRVATLDVECKQELATVQHLADLDAAAQTKYIEANRKFLADRRAVEDDVLANAVEYLEELGIEMP